jgi:hypothetical protein
MVRTSNDTICIVGNGRIVTPPDTRKADAANKENYIRAHSMAKNRLTHFQKKVDEMEKTMSDKNIHFEPLEDTVFPPISHQKYSLAYRRAQYQQCRDRANDLKKRLHHLTDLYKANIHIIYNTI